MGQDPSDIRTQIEETRSRVGEEIDALSYKTDVPARMGDYVGEKKEAVTGAVSGAKDAVMGATSTVLPSGERVGRLKDAAERNPMGLAVGGVAVGFVVGMLLPSTRVENRAMGETSDRLVDVARQTAGEAKESGKQIAHEVADSAREQGGELASSLQERAQHSVTS